MWHAWMIFCCATTVFIIGIAAVVEKLELMRETLIALFTDPDDYDGNGEEEGEFDGQ